jgi:hypothetical protein
MQPARPGPASQRMSRGGAGRPPPPPPRGLAAHLLAGLQHRTRHHAAHRALGVAQRLGQAGQHIGQQEVGPGDGAQRRADAPERGGEEEAGVTMEQAAGEEQQREQGRIQ